jgi:hypothetical protein
MGNSFRATVEVIVKVDSIEIKGENILDGSARLGSKANLDHIM